MLTKNKITKWILDSINYIIKKKKKAWLQRYNTNLYIINLIIFLFSVEGKLKTMVK